MIKRRKGKFVKRPGLTGPVFLIMCLLWPLLFSCSQANIRPEIYQRQPSQKIIEKVPFEKQGAYQCGPAALAGVLDYWGAHAKTGRIARGMVSKSAGGVLGIDLVVYAQKHGFKAKEYTGSIEDLRSKIDAGFPVIVKVDYGFWVYERNHFLTVVGYYNGDNGKPGGLIVHDGYTPFARVPEKKFMEQWKKTGYWALLITPKKIQVTGNQ